MIKPSERINQIEDIDLEAIGITRENRIYPEICGFTRSGAILKYLDEQHDKEQGGKG